tara:strand:- start:299 stop:691 length:393 start_codon:yes stop_codon:yes gene_type:complete
MEEKIGEELHGEIKNIPRNLLLHDLNLNVFLLIEFKKCKAIIKGDLGEAHIIQIIIMLSINVNQNLLINAIVVGAEGDVIWPEKYHPQNHVEVGRVLPIDNIALQIDQEVVVLDFVAGLEHGNMVNVNRS